MGSILMEAEDERPGADVDIRRNGLLEPPEAEAEARRSAIFKSEAAGIGGLKVEQLHCSLQSRPGCQGVQPMIAFAELGSSKSFRKQPHELARQQQQWPGQERIRRWACSYKLLGFLLNRAMPEKSAHLDVDRCILEVQFFH